MSVAIRQIRIEGDVAYVPLTQGYEAIIDAADAKAVGQYNWQILINHGNAYAVRGRAKTEGRRATSLHRFLMGEPDGVQVDHVNGNGLDNRRANLRLATHAQNVRNARRRVDNASGFKGVSFHRRLGKWRAYIAVNGKIAHLGYFETPELAHKAYCAASADLHKEYGRVA